MPDSRLPGFMIVVADTGPLNYLIRLGFPELLPEIYGRVEVPNAVLIEMQHPEASYEVRAWAASPPNWLEPVCVSRIDESLPSELGAGEREAISLALQLRADLLLIDERAGRQEAASRNIKVAGTLAVLLKASLLGLADFAETIQRLRAMGFESPARSRRLCSVVTLRRREIPEPKFPVYPSSPALQNRRAAIPHRTR